MVAVVSEIMVRVTGGSVTVSVKITVFVGGSRKGVGKIGGIKSGGRPLLFALVARFVVKNTVFRDGEVEVALVSWSVGKGGGIM